VPLVQRDSSIDFRERHRPSKRGQLDGLRVARSGDEEPGTVGHAPIVIDPSFAVRDDDVLTKLADGLVVKELLAAIEILGRVRGKAERSSS
jgi:hypothetical protein